MERINKNLIAPCGMNCAICKAYLREKNPCKGCRNIKDFGPKSRVICKIKNCSQRKGDYCFECNNFPCERLNHLDKRYREKYGMSEIQNLEEIHNKGINEFVRDEKEKWQSSKGIICVHDKKTY